MALDNLGLSLANVRRFEEAIDAHAQAADIFHETGDRHREGMGLTNLDAARARDREPGPIWAYGVQP